jgi:hypothetical protein
VGNKRLESEIRHERELREAGQKSLKHERELRTLSDQHERELRKEKEDAIEKERATQFSEYARRLDDLNHAHEAAVEAQAKTVPREVFDTYVKESSGKLELAAKNQTDKYEAIISTLVNKHDSDISTLTNNLQNEIQIRKSFEGSLNTWKFIATFLGVSGVGGVLLLFFTRH